MDTRDKKVFIPRAANRTIHTKPLLTAMNAVYPQVRQYCYFFAPDEGGNANDLGNFGNLWRLYIGSMQVVITWLFLFLLFRCNMEEISANEVYNNGSEISQCIWNWLLRSCVGFDI